MQRVSLFLVTALICSFGNSSAGQALDATETRILEIIESRADEAVAFLTRTVDINSGTLNPDGVRQVGRLYVEALDQIGFDTSLIEQPEELQRGPHFGGS